LWLQKLCLPMLLAVLVLLLLLLLLLLAEVPPLV
jgi:hypothetical protein